jgi:hypothetical protein
MFARHMPKSTISVFNATWAITGLSSYNSYTQFYRPDMATFNKWNTKLNVVTSNYVNTYIHTYICTHAHTPWIQKFAKIIVGYTEV